jgi:hypothetical protein
MDSADLGQDPVSGFCEHGNELWVSERKQAIV